MIKQAKFVWFNYMTGLYSFEISNWNLIHSAVFKFQVFRSILISRDKEAKDKFKFQ